MKSKKKSFCDRSVRSSAGSGKRARNDGVLNVEGSGKQYVYCR